LQPNKSSMGCEMGLKVSLPLITIGAANAFGWLFAYLRGAIVIADWITGIAGHDPHLIMLLMVALFTVIGDFIEPIPTIIIRMPLVNALTDAGNINPVHMGVVLITTLAFGLITPPYGLVLLMASKFVDVRFSHVRSMSCSSLRSPSRFVSRQWCSGCRSGLLIIHVSNLLSVRVTYDVVVRLEFGRQSAIGQNATTAKGRAAMVVPILLRHRTRSRRLRQIPARFFQAHLAARFAEMGLRRRHFRAQRRGFRQSGSMSLSSSTISAGDSTSLKVSQNMTIWKRSSRNPP